MKYVEDEDPVKEVYRIREAIQKKFGTPQNYHKYLRETQAEWEQKKEGGNRRDNAVLTA